MASNGNETDDENAPLLGKENEMNAVIRPNSIEEDLEQLPSPASGPERGVMHLPVRDPSQQSVERDSSGTVTIDNVTDRGKNQMGVLVLTSIMLVLVSVTFAQSLSPFMIPGSNNICPKYQEVIIIYMAVGILVIVAMFLHKHAITETSTAGGVNSNVTGNQIKHILRDYLSVVGMFFFFPFACILDLSNIIADSSCGETWRLCGDEFYREYLVDTFYHFIRILFMGAEIAFCCMFHGKRFKESATVRFGIMIVMAANLGLWFQSLVCEATQLDGPEIDEGKKCSNESGLVLSHNNVPENWQACLNETSVAHQVMHTMTRYLYPFAIEFSLLVGEVLITKFVSHAHQSQAPDGNLVHVQQPRTSPVTVSRSILTVSNISRANEMVGVVGDNYGPIQNNPSAHFVTRLGQLLSVFIIAIGLFASFAYICLAFVEAYAQGEIVIIDGVNWGKVYETYSMINYIVISALVVVGYACGYGLKVQEKQLHGLDWLVLISAFGPFMREIIAVIALASAYDRMSAYDFPDILIGNRLAIWLQLVIQAPFIFLSDRWTLAEEQRNRPRYLCQEKVLKAIILCLAVANLASWISDSIILMHFMSINSEAMATVFNVGNFQIVEHISLPMIVFYRFNSFLLFTRAFIGD